jgi:excisionase family DNA binding protein
VEKNVVLTTNEAIKYLKISKPTFLKYIRFGRIKAIKAGKGWRILQTELNRFLRGEMAEEIGKEIIDTGWRKEGYGGTN